MLALLTTTGISALAASAFASWRVRNAAFGDIDYDWLCNELELDTINADGLIRFKDGRLALAYQITGIAYDAIEQDVQEAMKDGRTSLFKSISEHKCDARIFVVKREEFLNEKNDWPSAGLTEIGEAERKLFNKSFTTQYFLLVSAEKEKSLYECETILLPVVKPYEIAKLTDTKLRSFLNFVICGELKDNIPDISANLSGCLPLSDMKFDRDSGHIHTWTPNELIYSITGVKEWPQVVDGRIIGDILSLPFELEICHILSPIDSNLGRGLLRRIEVTESTMPFGNETLEEAAGASIQLINEEHGFFKSQFFIIARARSLTELNEITTRISNILAQKQVVYSTETVASAAAWFSRLPGHKQQFVRPLNLFDANLSALWSLSSAPVGQKSSPFGQKPVRLLATPSGTAYQFQFHVSDKPQSLGNYLVFAPSGSGKSTLMMYLLGGLAKFEGIRSYIFDSKEGARFMIEAMGGHYQSYDSISMNPLDVGDDNEANRHRINLILRAMLGEVDIPQDEIENVLKHVLSTAFSLNCPDRTLNNIFPLSFPTDSRLKGLFGQWVTDQKGYQGQYAHIFNAPHDSLSSILTQSHMIGINMNEALEDPKLGPAIVAHISSRISKAAQASPGFNIFIDEAAKLLENPGFLNLAKEMFREYRKLNGCVGMAFQDPAALFNTGASEAFLENAATLIFFPNAKVNPQSLERFNLNAEQIDFIKKSGFSGEGRRVLLVKQDGSTGYHESAIVDVDLAPLGGALRYFRAGVDANAHLQRIKESHGESWLEYL